MNKEINTVSNNQVIFSLCHTTARLNPEGWREAIQAWKDRADHPELVEHIFVIDKAMTPEELDTNNEATESLQDLPIFEKVKIHINGGRRCCVDGWNLAAQMSEGLFLINVADDLFPPEHWDTLLTEELKKSNQISLNWDKQEIVMDVDTGAPNWAAAGPVGGLLTFCFMTRKYYERYGYMLYPEYLTVYSDNDFTDQAKRDGVVVDARHLKFDHRHPLYSPGVKTDAVYENQSRSEAWDVGRKVYIKRSKSRGYVVRKKITVCLPGEHYSALWVSEWTKLLTTMSQFMDVCPVFCYSTNVYVTRASLANAVVQTKPSPDYVLWIDDDNLLNFNQLLVMIKDLEDNPRVDSVSAWTWIMGDGLSSPARISAGHFIPNTITDHCYALRQEDMQASDKDLIEVDWTGFPVVLMRYEAIVKAGGHVAFQPHQAPAGHPFGYYGEDASFCINAKKNGVRMCVDRRIKVPHLKLQGVEPIMPTTAREASEEIGQEVTA